MGSVQTDPQAQSLNMKVFAALLACAALASARNLKLDELEFGFCDGANQDVLSLDNISVEPFPLVIATGESLTISVAVTLNEPVPVGATVDLKIKKEGLIPIQIPCIPIDDISIGSCHYDGDALVVVLPEIPGIIVDLLASGTYYADATVNYADGTQMTCIYIRVELTGSK